MRQCLDRRLHQLDGIRDGSRGQASGAEKGRWYPRQDSNLCTRLRRPVLYPLSYGGEIAFYYKSVPSKIKLLR